MQSDRRSSVECLDGDAYLQGEFFKFSKSDFLRTDSEDARELAGTILALAAQYNQIKDLHELVLIEIRKMAKVRRGIRPEVGHLVGRYEMLSRFLYGTVYELLKFLEKCPQKLESSLFLELIERLPGEHKEYWQEIVGTAKDGKATLLGRAIMEVRNNVTFHFQNPVNFIRGFECSISSGTKDDGYVSEGKNMASTRFFFADAASQGYVRKSFGLEYEEDTFLSFMSLAKRINLTLYQLVLSYLQVHLRKGCHEAKFEYDPTGKKLFDNAAGL